MDTVPEKVLVDLSDVEFLASMGIRLLILNAKSVFSRGGRMALLRTKPEIRNRLEITDVAMIILIYDGLESAEVMLLA
jgi:anti-anti-sigma factor